ncbi:MAG: prenyltransferase/squalene oxidase repeat-containing protein [Acidimicrobiales bacterium]
MTSGGAGGRPGGSLLAIRRIGATALADLLRRPASRPVPADSTSWPARVDAGLGWLCRAQDQGHDRGVSYGYTVRGGWQPSYVETTGYIINTFLRAGAALDRPELVQRAHEAGRWLCRVQLPDGGFANPGLDPGAGVVFDTGQDLHGLVSLAEATGGVAGDSSLIEAVRRAAGWLVGIADDEGRWTRNTFNGIPHVYNSRTAWALVRAGHLLDDPDAVKVAEANLDWACSQQRANGWFDQCAFTVDAPPFTHTTAYAGRGLLESGLLLGNERYIQAAREVAEAAARHLGPAGLLPGRISVEGNAVGRSSCLTGNAQFAIIWLKLAELDADARFRQWAEQTLRATAAHQSLTGPAEIRGAIKGSHPVWGRYAPLGYPNWPTKFFVDALLLSMPSSDTEAAP